MILLTDDVQNSEEFGPFWWVLMIFYLILVIAPWVFIIFRYGIFRKLRIHLIMHIGNELPSLY